MARRPNRAEQAALDLLEEVGVDAPPVDVEDIAATTLGIKVRYASLESGLSGALLRADDGTVVLGVNDWHHPRRQRFTIAHELGHYRLHPDALFLDGVLKRDNVSSLAIRSHEIEANAFAAELLMPRHFVLRELKAILTAGGEVDSRRSIKQLSELFDVSEQAMQLRLVNLGLATSF